jgi:hypothetical protein
MDKAQYSIFDIAAFFDKLPRLNFDFSRTVSTDVTL